MKNQENISEYSKLMSESLFNNISNKLSKGNKYYALIGPKNIGKGYALNCIKKILKQNNQIHTIYFDFSKFRGISFKEFIDNIAQKMFVNILYEENNEKRLSAYILEIMELFFKSEEKKTIIIIKNITALSISIAYEFLEALSSLHQNNKLKNRLSAIVSGRENFLKMAQGDNSPFRFAEKIIIRGGKKELLKKYFKKEFNNKAFNKKAEDYLYEQIGGSYLPMIEISGLIKRKVNKKKWTKNDLKKILENDDTIIQKKMFESANFRTLLKNIEFRRKAFNDLNKILNNKNGVHSLSNKEPISFLEVSGAVWLDNNRKAHICPLLRRFFRKIFTNLYKGDVFCRLSEWDEACKCYKNSPLSEKYRSVSGEDRFRLLNILVHWENSMGKAAKKGADDVIDFFLKGAEHLLVFDRGMVIIEKQTNLLISKKKFGFYNNKEEKKKEFESDIKKYEFKEKNVRLDKNKRIIYCKIPPQLIKEGEGLIYIKLERRQIDRRIDTTIFKAIKRYIEKFRENIQYALRNFYRKELGKITNTLDNALSDFTKYLTQTPLDLKIALNKVCETLVKGFYKSIILYEVNSDLAEFTHRYEAGKINLESKTHKFLDNIKAKSNKKQNIVNFITKHIKNNDIIPMIVEEKVIGIILFERKDQKIPGNEEINLLKQFAKHLAVIYRLAIRQIILRDALSALDDPVILNNIKKQAIFLNKNAAKLIGLNEETGWLKDPIDINNQLAPNLNNKDKKLTNIAFNNRLNNIQKTEQGHRIYLPDYNKHDFKSIDWLGNILKDHRKKNNIGSIERYHNISLMFSLLDVIKKAWNKNDKKDRSRIFLNHLNELGYSESRIWLIKDKNQKKEFISFVGNGFKDDKKQNIFENNKLTISNNNEMLASWFCIIEHEPKIFIHDNKLEGTPVKPSQPETTILGQHGWRTGNLIHPNIINRKDGDIRIEIPLIIAEKKAIGKIVLIKSPEKFVPIDIQYLNLVAQNIGAAIQAAINREENLNKIQQINDEQIIIGRMLSHRMAGSLSFAKNIISKLNKKNKDKISKIYLKYLRYHTAKTGIVIYYFLGGMEKPSGNFKEIKVKNLLESVKDFVGLEIKDVKNHLSLKAIGWDCKIKIDIKEDITIKGDEILLSNALESLVINAFTALKDKKESGEIQLICKKTIDCIKIILKSNGEPAEKNILDYIKKVISSSGEKKSLISLTPPVSSSNKKGYIGKGLGLKLTTWIISYIHTWDIKLTSDDNEAPCFEIIIK